MCLVRLFVVFVLIKGGHPDDSAIPPSGLSSLTGRKCVPPAKKKMFYLGRENVLGYKNLVRVEKKPPPPPPHKKQLFV